MSLPLVERVSARRFFLYRRTLRRIGQPAARDSEEDLIRLLLCPRSAFAARTRRIPVVVRDSGGRALATAVWMVAEGLPDTLQIAFLDLAPEGGQQALSILLDASRQHAASLGLPQIVIGLNGHVNNGFGFATKDAGQPCFGVPSNPAYYADWLRPHVDHIQKMTSYAYDVGAFSFGRHARVLPGLFRRYRFRAADFSDIRREIACYTALNNACFEGHPFYFTRTPAEDYELFHSFRLFLKPEHFIVAMDGDRPVGFLLWYPDFDALVPPGGRLGLGALWRYRIRHQPIRRCKIAEIGVVPSHQHRGVALGMMAECFARIRDRFAICETGWILDENEQSLSLNTRWLDAPAHTYEAYVIGSRVR
ncbi:MAG TPA: hypothetical protein DCS43_10540 [Verrucomicrobia bacterium]|nr:hypothetical protein [Verrucomicrobiota bacterium]